MSRIEFRNRKYKMTWILLIPIFVLAISTETHASAVDEPTCVSKFDYDFKMMSKIVDQEKQLKALIASLDEQKTIINQLMTERENYGSTFTVWGKKTCPVNGTSLVYSGYMAGPLHKHSGSGSNFLCLTSSPLCGHYDEQINSEGKIYGVEYRFWNHRATGASKFFGQNVFNKNAPCAVCHTTRGATIMIAGRNQCFGGWTKEYSGYLVSGHHGHPQASEYICLAGNVDVLDANEANDGESVLYFVEGVCGKSLPCPPYVNGRELACVVCSL